MSKGQIIIRDSTTDDVAGLTLLINELGYKTSFAEMEHRFKTISSNPGR